MRPRILPGIFIACVIIAGTGFIAFRPNAGKFDARAATNIERLCGNRSDCQLYISDIVKNELVTSPSWDTLYEFGSSNTNEVISKAIGAPFAKDHDLRRVVVMMRDHYIVYSEVEDQGIEIPLDGEIVISCKPFNGAFASCPANALLRIKKIHTRGDWARLYSRSGTAYLLTQVN